MHEWTPAARNRLDAYLGEVRAALPNDADDKDEIVSLLAEHLTLEVEAQCEQVITPEHVERAIRVAGSPAEIAGGAPIPKPAPAPEPQKPARIPLRPGFHFFGIWLPLAAIVVEFVWAPMNFYYADPMPTLPLFLLLCLVPAGNGLIWWTLRQGDAAPTWHRSAAFALAGGLLVFTGCYSLFYLPTIILAVLAMMLMGFGLLGLSPHFSFLASLRARALLSKAFPGEVPENRPARRWWWYGAAAMTLLLAAYFGRMAGLEQGMRLAASDDAKSMQRGYSQLWWLAGGRYVLDRCYMPPRSRVGWMEMGEFDDFDNGGGSRDTQRGAWFATQEEARAAYFALTGESYTAHAAPRRFSERWQLAGLTPPPWLQTPDRFRGGEQIGGELHGLSLAESRIDATLFCEEGTSGESTAYLEWVMTFHNDTAEVQESRTLLHLPPGAVASRLTLWINGEEREAAFGGRDQVRAAYQEVAVVRRQDPALLTTQGPDRVLLQCFPIPARGSLKVKLGVTAPLLARGGQAYLRLPDIVDRNHALDPDGNHHVWIEATAPLTSGIGELAVEKVNGVHALRGEVPLQRPLRSWMGWVAVPALVQPRSYTASLSELHAGVSITPAASAATAAGPVWLVVDGGAGMADIEADWGAMLDAFPKGTAFHAIVAKPDLPALATEDAAELARWLERIRFAGGTDPLPALEAAWLEASAVENSRVVWIHGPYPMARPATAGLEQLLQRRPPVTQDGQPRLFDVQLIPGPNRVLDALGPVRGLTVVPVVNGVSESLRYFAEYGRLEDFERRYTLDTEAVPQAIDAAPGSDHLVRLAVYDAVLDKLGQRDNDLTVEARVLAQRTRLVTPVTGAVVLERQEQYERHGLNPSDDQDAIAQIPGIPEPEEWALIIVALIAFLFLLKKRLRPAGSARGPEAAV